MTENKTHLMSSFIVRSTNEKDYFQLFFNGKEELINKLNEERSVSALQRELERISKRTDFKIRNLVYQAAWRPNLRVAETFQKGRVFLVGGKQIPQTGWETLLTTSRRCAYAFPYRRSGTQF